MAVWFATPYTLRRTMLEALMTTPSDPLLGLERRALRHAFEDGAIDLLLGLFTLMVGVATQNRAFLGLAVVYLGTLAVAWRAFHDRLTSRRTGYAELPGDPARQLLAAVLTAGCLTMAVVAAVTMPSGRAWAVDRWPEWSPLLSGGILAAAFAYTARRTGLARFAAYAVAAAGLSLFFWLYPFGPRINASDRLTLSLFALSAILLATGSVVIALFVRRHPLVTLPEGPDVR